MTLKVMQIRKVCHWGESVWIMSFPYDRNLISQMKKIPHGLYWGSVETPELVDGFLWVIIPGNRIFDTP